MMQDRRHIHEESGQAFSTGSVRLPAVWLQMGQALILIHGGNVVASSADPSYRVELTPLGAVERLKETI